MEHRNYFNLDISAPIFRILKEEQALWWKTVCNDKELYINIRKDNCINVYYKGCSVMELEYGPRKGLTAKISNEYIEEKYHNMIIRTYGKKCSIMNPKDIVKIIDSIRKQIDKYTKTNNDENVKELAFQGEEYLRGKYIDSEYAFVYSQPKHKLIRIDLISINSDGLIEFIELKRISDRRLNSKSPIPEIVEQIDWYNKFIEDYGVEIEEYYKNVQKIMRNLEINNPCIDIDIKGVCPKLRLLFIPYDSQKWKNIRNGDKKTRIQRIEKIANLLKEKGVKSNINEV